MRLGHSRLTVNSCGGEQRRRAKLHSTRVAGSNQTSRSNTFTCRLLFINVMNAMRGGRSKWFASASVRSQKMRAGSFFMGRWTPKSAASDSLFFGWCEVIEIKVSKSQMKVFAPKSTA
jgi:hypothetical protein